jgi:hypothetical protein
MSDRDFDLYNMKVNRLTHFEKLLVTLDSIYLAGLYFVFKYPDHSWVSLIICSSILICISVSHIHLLLVSTSYVIDMIDMEKKLNISHLAKKWQRFSKELNGTHFFISFSPAILTVISIPLLGIIQYDRNRFILSIIITICYIILISFLAIKPFKSVNSKLQSAIVQNEQF